MPKGAMQIPKVMSTPAKGLEIDQVNWSADAALVRDGADGGVTVDGIFCGDDFFGAKIDTADQHSDDELDDRELVEEVSKYHRQRVQNPTDLEWHNSDIELQMPAALRTKVAAGVDGGERPPAILPFERHAFLSGARSHNMDLWLGPSCSDLIISDCGAVRSPSIKWP